MNPISWAAWKPVAPFVAAALLAVCIGAYFKGRDDENDAWKIRMAEEAEKARKTEQRLQGEADAIKDKLTAQNNAIASQLADALGRLRDRPKRMPESSRAACKGGTGAELSAEDAGFLIWEAYRADRIKAALEACQDWAESVKSASK